MDAAFLTGLWEFAGYRTEDRVIVPPYGMADTTLRELLFFDADGTFFFAKYPDNESLYYEPETRRLVSPTIDGPLVAGTWKLEGNQLIEQVPHGEQSFEVERLDGDRLLVKEPAGEGRPAYEVVYDRADVESFPAPPLRADDDDVPSVDPETALVLVQMVQNEVGALITAGRYNSAHRLAQRGARLCERFFGTDHPNTAACLSTLGGCLVKVRETAAAIAELERAKRIYETHFGADDLGTANVLNNLSLAYRGAHRYRAAIEAASAAARIRLSQLGLQDRRTATSATNLGLALHDLGLLDSPAIEPDALAGTLERCAAMLQAEPAEDLFTLAYGRASHERRYVHVMFAIRQQQILVAKQPEDVAMRRQYLHDAQKHLRAAVDVPASRFSAHLKRMDRSQLGPLSLATLQYVFPSFAGGIEEATERAEALRRHGIDPDATPTLADHRRRNVQGLGIGMKLVDRQFRRYAGENNLPSQRYSSVCIDASGDDRQTLCRELFEYTDPRIPGVVFVSDTWDAALMEAMSAAGLPRPRVHGIFVFLLAPPDEEERRAFRHFYEPVLARVSNPEGLSIVFIPTELEEVVIDDVVDLRQPAAQEWLFRFFRDGDGAVWVKNASARARGFEDMLPSLVYPEYGGSGATKSIGSWMRSAGVQGLVFPSARSNASIEVDEHAVVRSFHGWNFVDYRDIELVPDMAAHADYNDWYRFQAGRQEAPVLHRDGASWTIDGAERRYEQTRGFLLELLAAIA